MAACVHPPRFNVDLCEANSPHGQPLACLIESGPRFEGKSECVYWNDQELIYY